MTQNVRYLQWQQAQAATEALLRSRASALERYTFYLRLLGLHTRPGHRPGSLHDRPRPRADRGQLRRRLPGPRRPIRPADPHAGLPAAATRPGQLTRRRSRAHPAPGSSTSTPTRTPSSTPTCRTRATTTRRISPRHHRRRRTRHSLTSTVDLHYWGLGAHSTVFGGDKLLAIQQVPAPRSCRTPRPGSRTRGRWRRGQPGYQRRADDWLLQANLAARELSQLGRQMLTSMHHRAGRAPRIHHRQGPGRPEPGRARLPADQVHQRGAVRLDARPAVQPATTSTTGSPSTPPAKPSRP